MQSLYGSCEKQGFVQVAVRRAVRLRECPIGEVSMSCSHAVNILSLFCLRGDLQFLYYFIFFSVCLKELLESMGLQ